MDRRRCHRSGGVYHDGFLYVTRWTKGNIRYMFCNKKREWGCTATGKINVQEGSEFIPVNQHHNHPRDENRGAVTEFRKQLKEACIQERGTLKNIYERVSTRNIDGAVEVPFNTIRSTMLRWRRATTPNVPVTLRDLVEILQTGMVEVNGQCAVIFANREFLQNFGDSQHLFIDGTFKAVPRRPNFHQILTIFATSMDHAFPVVHIFMERKSKTLYDAIFQYILDNFPPFVNGNIVTDYEVALIQSLRNKFPNATLHGCFFHYCQAVLRKARSLGIVQQIEGRASGRIFLKKYYCLALLPAEMIQPTFVSLQHDVDYGQIFRELNEYIRRQWIERVTVQHFSVFRQQHRTNNVMESYHRRLNSKLSRHPGVWDLMEILIEIQDVALIELAQLEQRNNVFRIAKKNVVFDGRLNNAWDKLSDGRFTVGDFLRQAVHFVEGLHGQLYQWNEDATAEEQPVVAADNLHHLLAPAPPADPPMPVIAASPLRPALFEEPPTPRFTATSPPPLVPILLNSPPRHNISVPSTSRSALVISVPSLVPIHRNSPPQENLSLPSTSRGVPVASEPPRVRFISNSSDSLSSSPPPPPMYLPSTSCGIYIASESPRIRSNSNSSDSLSSTAASPAPMYLPSTSHDVSFALESPRIRSLSNSSDSHFSSPPPPAPIHNFPPIPDAVLEAFARWDDDEEEVLFRTVERWQPNTEAIEFDEETTSAHLRCNICLVNQVQYAMECGHLFCSTCTTVLYNRDPANCGICRAELNEVPRAVFFV